MFGQISSHAMNGAVIEAEPPAPFLSILVPVYNADQYLAECLASVVQQRPRFAYEIIILDDCSTDSSNAIIAQCAAENPGVIHTLNHPANRGISAARNNLIAAARGEYIWFLDADDTLNAGALEEWWTIAATHAPDVCLCDFTVDGKGQIAGFSGPAAALVRDRDALVRGVFASRKMHFWSKIFRRSMWTETIACPVGHVFEDLATVPWLLLNARSFFYMPKSWITYRQNSGSIMARISRSRGFAERQNADLAGALNGYYRGLSERMVVVPDETRFAIAHFLAKEFTKICHRLLKARLWRHRWAENRLLLQNYRRTMEAASPITFERLVRHYAQRKQWVHYGLLRFCCAITR